LKKLLSLDKRNLDWAIHSAGIAITVGALVYVGAKIATSANVLWTDFSDPTFLSVVAASACIYPLSCSLLGIAWIMLVDFAGKGARIGFRDGLIIAGRSQILKYLPSNVLHLVGRFGLAKKAGASHASLVFATLAEPGILIAVASVLSTIFALPLFLKFVLPALGSRSAPAIVVALGIMGAVVLWWFKRQGILHRKVVLAIAGAMSPSF
jgi:glycosyltransferase 2 family protein